MKKKNGNILLVLYKYKLYRSKMWNDRVIFFYLILFIHLFLRNDNGPHAVTGSYAYVRNNSSSIMILQLTAANVDRWIREFNRIIRNSRRNHCVQR